MNSASVPDRVWMNVVHLDKFVHAFMYGVLCFLYLKAFRKIRIPLNVMVLSSVIAVFTGIVIEMLQWIIDAGRCFELLDVMANITGVLITAFVIKK